MYIVQRTHTYILQLQLQLQTRVKTSSLDRDVGTTGPEQHATCDMRLKVGIVLLLLLVERDGNGNAKGYGMYAVRKWKGGGEGRDEERRGEESQPGWLVCWLVEALAGPGWCDVIFQ